MNYDFSSEFRLLAYDERDFSSSSFPKSTYILWSSEYDCKIITVRPFRTDPPPVARAPRCLQSRNQSLCEILGYTWPWVCSAKWLDLGLLGEW